MVICPQEKSRPPIYLVLYGFLNLNDTQSSSDYKVDRAHELFPPRDPVGPARGGKGAGDLKASLPKAT